MTEPTAVWVYAVAEDDLAADGNDLAGLTGVGGTPVRAVTAAGLAAITGNVPLADFDEAALRRNLEDLDWLEVTARAHHQVIAAVARRGPVVPVRLATVYRDEAGVAAALGEHQEDFRAALDRLGRRREWGVKVYAAAPPAAGDGPQPAPAHGGNRASGPGAAYLQRRRRDLAARDQARQDAAASAELIHARLADLAAGTSLHPPQSPQLAGGRAQMILNAAYLLDQQRDDEFAAAVGALAERHPAVRLELTGPWPPYSFTSEPVPLARS